MRSESQGSAHIGEVAERTGLSHRTIRYYEEMGLVTPSGRSEGGFRLYSSADVDRLLMITPMKPLGFSIDEIREVLAALDILVAQEQGAGEQPAEPESAAARATVQAAHERAQEKVVQLQAIARRAENFTDHVGKVLG